MPQFLEKMHETINRLSGYGVEQPQEEPGPDYQPAVTARKSLVSKDHIISMIDGKPYKTLKRHLSTHGLTPAQYRERYGLKADYPMVAENYAAMRRGLAKKIGLGRKPGAKVTAKSNDAAGSDAAPKRRGPRAKNAD